MRVRFIGDPNQGGEGPEGFSLFGLDFVKGEWTAVDAAVFAKLSGNGHFEAEEGQAPAEDAELEVMRQLLREQGVKFHHKAGRDKLQALLDEACA